MNLSEALSEKRIKLNPQSTCKNDIIAELVQLAVKDGYIRDAAEFTKKVLEREALHSTGLTHGIAIPHAQDENLNAVIACLGICQNGVEFESADSQPARLIFLIAADKHRDASYLSLLSRIIRIFSKERVREQVLAAQSAREIIQIITDAEEQLLTHTVYGSHKAL